MLDATADGSALRPGPLPVAECKDADRTSRLAGTAAGRSRAARLTGWMDNLPAADAYDAIAMAKSTKEGGRSSSSSNVHAGMWAGYLAFCKHLKVDPIKVDPATAAHVANFYKCRLHPRTANVEAHLGPDGFVSGAFKSVTFRRFRIYSTCADMHSDLNF